MMSSPSSRRPLRERCAVTLHIRTSFYDSIPPKGHLEPHVSNLPRRKKRIPAPSAKPSEPPLVDISCLQELIPGLSLAFADDSGMSDVQPGWPTHILSVTTHPRRSGHGVGMVEETIDGTGVHRLHLVVPEKAIDNSHTHLTRAQLLAARDFIALALPYGCELPTLIPPCSARLLITTPVDRAADAVSVAACYVAFMSDTDVGTVVGLVDEEEEVRGEWQGVLSQEGIEYAEEVACVE